MNKSERVLIIAEAGVNHNGDIGLAIELVDAAAEAGADIVKFQTFNASALVSRDAKQADYQIANTGMQVGQHEMLRQLELTREMHFDIIAHCKKMRIAFLSTPFDDESFDLLNDLGMSYWKIPSGEITNYSYLKKVALNRSPIILSTGMSSLGDVEAAIAVLEKFGRNRDEIVVLHCTTEYPAPLCDVNLRAMVSMRRAFNTKVGYSDHTEGIHIPVAAVAMGACLIEKHLTLDRKLPGPDHAASIEPDSFREMVAAIRSIEDAMGDGIKRVADSEKKNIAIARKSIVAARTIAAGSIINEADLTVRRPGHGISPMRWDDVVGSTAHRDYSEGEMILL